MLQICAVMRRETLASRDDKVLKMGGTQSFSNLNFIWPKFRKGDRDHSKIGKIRGVVTRRKEDARQPR